MKKVQPIDCEQALLRIFELVDHELHGDERKAMEEHLHTCKSCFSRAEFERRLKAKLTGLRDDQPNVRMRGRIERLLKAI
jgi:anti-sigma factor (TIGR02949 family)